MATSNRFAILPQALPDVLQVVPTMIPDSRGYFTELVRDDLLTHAGIGHFVQENQSRSVRHVVRGLHFQNEPRAFGKLVRCVRGRVFDVAVDIRRGSPTYRRWLGLELDEDHPAMLWIPPGFAHGFCALSDVADVVYKQTDYWSPEHERTIRWDDPALAIRWPVSSPLLSSKDAGAPPLDDIDNHFVYGGTAT